ncbi:MAG TPA: OmpA family protein [Nitrospira sp.]|nr:OmpA family protein [Nitrospira sp.]MBS0173318.1 OmpA family protein [Nitrospira sp.]MBX3336803.1 OmpA family protein [Nitrospira sp.]MCW5779371.1 OmpA family protein [Nitrospira sp.]HMZ54611.1 OmpA family protein [Nitrospira sp.]
MRPHSSPDSSEQSSVLTIGVTDLMTSLAVIFILLFSAYVTKVSETEAQTKVSVPDSVPEVRVAKTMTEDIRGALRDHFQRFDLSLDADPTDPNVVRIVVPDALLNFEFGKGTLSAVADQFLVDAMPTYAALLCGAMRDRIDSLVIEGHTDDRGSDIYNLKLSQERSLNVMVKGLEVIKDSAPWAYRCFHEKTSASGRGRQDLVLDQSRGLDREKSRRVVFKIRLRSTDQLVEAGDSTRSLDSPTVSSRLF